MQGQYAQHVPSPAPALCSGTRSTHKTATMCILASPLAVPYVHISALRAAALHINNNVQGQL